MGSRHPAFEGAALGRALHAAVPVGRKHKKIAGQEQAGRCLAAITKRLDQQLEGRRGMPSAWIEQVQPVKGL